MSGTGTGMWFRSSKSAGCGRYIEARTDFTSSPFAKLLSVLRSRARPQRALCVDIDGVQRGLRGDEQPVALAPAEANVGDELRDGDRADMGAVRRVAEIGRA